MKRRFKVTFVCEADAEAVANGDAEAASDVAQCVKDMLDEVIDHDGSDGMLSSVFNFDAEELK